VFFASAGQKIERKRGYLLRISVWKVEDELLSNESNKEWEDYRVISSYTSLQFTNS
jgi:hypothetical protein